MNRFLKSISLLVALLFLCACTATMNVQRPENTLEDPQKTESTSTEATNVDDSLPLIELSSDLLYDILSADFAYNNGQYKEAFNKFMEIAELTQDYRIAKRAAEISAREKNAEDALKAVKLWYQLSPNGAEAEKYLIGFLVIEDKKDELEDHILEALSRAPIGNRGALIYQYQQYLASDKDSIAALKVMENITSRYSDLPEAHIALSQMAFTNKNYTKAEEAAKEALRLKPDSELAVLTLAQAQVEPKVSIQTMTEFLKQYPDSREVRVANGRMLIGQKEYDKAQVEFKKILEKHPNDVMALYSLGLLAIQQNDYKNAEKYLKQYLNTPQKLQQKDAEAYQAIFLLAQLAEEQKNYKAALEWVAKITVDDDSESWVMAQTKRAQILVKEGKIKQARKELAMLRSEYPMEEERLVLAESQILRSANRIQEAYAFLKSNYKRYYSNINILYDFSLTAEKVKRFNEMEKALNRIIEMDKKNHLAYNALGYSLADRNIRLEEAYIYIAKALALAPEDPFIIDSMGWVLYRQNKLKEAELMLRRSYELLPEAEVMTHLGEVLWFSDQKKEAQTLFEKAYEKEPHNETLLDTIKRLNITVKSK